MPRVNLHAHEASASGDSDTPLYKMLDEYANRGYALAGMVGHDARPSGPPRWGPTDVIYGIEHEIRGPPNRIHVVEFPDHNFRFLAHPGSSWPEDTKRKAREFMRENSIHAVEKYNAGEEEYEGHIAGVIELANDDAHSPGAVGTSFMSVSKPSRPFYAIGRQATLRNPGQNSASLGATVRKYATIAANLGKITRE